MTQPDILSIADQVRDALWKIEASAPPPLDSPSGLVLTGTGAAAIAARLAVEITQTMAHRVVAVAPAGAIPRWVDSRWTVLCMDYTGDESETLESFRQAKQRAANLLVATSGGELAAQARAAAVPVLAFAGGFDPLDAMAYPLVAALEAAALCGAAPSLRAQIERAADAVADRADAYRDSRRPAELAERVHGRPPVLVAGDRADAIAEYWALRFSRAGSWPVIATTEDIRSGFPVPGVIVGLADGAEDLPGDWLDAREDADDRLGEVLIQLLLGALVANRLASLRGSTEGEDATSRRAHVTHVEKPWGHETIWAQTEQYVGKVLFVRAGCSLSLQYHERKDESWLVQHGRARLELGQAGTDELEEIEVLPGDAFRYRPGTVHRVTALEDTTILEASTPHLDDVVRLADAYGRVSGR